MNHVMFPRINFTHASRDDNLRFRFGRLSRSFENHNYFFKATDPFQRDHFRIVIDFISLSMFHFVAIFDHLR